VDCLAYLDQGLNVAIIGAGYAGMAAAVTLAQHAVSVTVYEASKTLGGRARRVQVDELALDNGQHLLLGAYTETLRLVKLVAPDINAWARQPLTLRTLDGMQLRAPHLPAPFNTLIALLTATGLSAAERYAALRFMLVQRVKRFNLASDCSVARLLEQHGQPATLVHKLWAPLCIAALNTPPTTASAQVFLNVLRDSLVQRRADSDMILPTRDLSTLFPEPAAAYVRMHGGKVLSECAINTIVAEGSGFSLAGQHFTHLICAVGPHQAARLLVDLPKLNLLRDALAQLRYQPIATIYMQYPASVKLTEPMLGLSGEFAQWVFDRGITHGQHGLLAVVISAEGRYRTLNHTELAVQVEMELRQALGTLPVRLWHQVIIEKRATFSCDVGVQRPPQATPLENFYLAGDYTDSDYPATLEAATRSGVKCAHLVLERS
jgi:squalene-associated FAD-dependent desaturase